MKKFSKKISDFTAARWNVDPVVCRFHLPFLLSYTTDRWHKHCDFYELVIVTGSSLINEMPAERKLLRSGDFLLFAPGSIHHYCKMNSTAYINILFLPSMLEIPGLDLTGMESIKRLLPPPGGCSEIFKLSTDLLPGVIKLAEEMKTEEFLKKTGYKQYQETLFLQMMIFLSRNLDLPECDAPPSAIVNIGNAVRFMEHHLSEQLSLGELAKNVSMSESSFRHNFKNITGFSPKHYWNILRLQNAVQLFYSGRSFAEAAQMSGFRDTAYFSRLFRKQTGLSPQAFYKKYSQKEIKKSFLLENLTFGK